MIKIEPWSVLATWPYDSTNLQEGMLSTLAFRQHVIRLVKSVASSRSLLYFTMMKLHPSNLTIMLSMLCLILPAVLIAQTTGDAPPNAAEQHPKPDSGSSNYYLDEFNWLMEDQKGNTGQVATDQTFGSVTIGTQTWASVNLNVSTFRNGDHIDEMRDAIDWRLNSLSPAWCHYDNDPSNGERYGKLYNTAAINDRRGLAPEGWHIPTEDEWNTLLNYLGKEAFNKLKSTDNWKDGKNGSNESRFAALPTGCRDKNGAFQFGSENAYWWSATNDPSGSGNMAFFIRYYMLVVDEDAFDNYGFSVRCIKD